MKTSHIIIGLLALAGVVTAVVISSKKKKVVDESPSNGDKLTDADWKALMDAVLDAEKRGGKSNALSVISKTPSLEADIKTLFLNNANRSQYNVLMANLKANKNKPETIKKRNIAILQFITEISSKKS